MNPGLPRDNMRQHPGVRRALHATATPVLLLATLQTGEAKPAAHQTIAAQATGLVWYHN